MAQQQQKDRRLEREIFSPALKQAVRKAQAEDHSLSDVVVAAANAYLNMVVGLLGRDEALALLEDQASFLRSNTGQ
ncbi:MAG: hypothetical protein ACQERN_06145 [Thermodesulfobacteriota bacterium]